MNTANVWLRGLYQEDCVKADRGADPKILVNLHVHGMRREATSRLFEKRMGVMEVSDVTGHKTLTM